MSDFRPPPPNPNGAHIIKECLDILREEGFEPQPLPEDPRIPADIIAAFKAWSFDFLDVVVPKQTQPKRVFVPSGITRRQLNLITLKWAIVYIRYGVKSVSYKECLTSIRWSVANTLHAWGYEELDPVLCMPEYFIWGVYKEWEEVAQKDREGKDRTFSIEKIKELRAHAAKEYPDLYES